ncbi:MAG: L-aspartate oxidase, partial [Rubrobacteraceae bacterium]
CSLRSPGVGSRAAKRMPPDSRPRRSSRSETNTRYAQGGIIYAGPDDAPDLLVRDILAAGGGNKVAAEILANEEPPLVRRLLIEELGVPFDRYEEGFEGFHLTREGAHSVPRILHHRDTTGREIQLALARAVREEKRIMVLPGAEAVELAMSGRHCAGVHAVKDGEAFTIAANSVVLATGGLGALYEHTTNPPGATGGGYALALRAGASVRDLHYAQFHPTALYSPGGDRFLISEAARGEGAILLDPDGEEFVEHSLGSLAPRDVVAREMWAMMERTGSPRAFLDITHRSDARLEERFPAIHARCLEEGIDMSEEPIPVVPAAHYSCGGVATDLHGRTTAPGLFAAGEVANTGLHGPASPRPRFSKVSSSGGGRERRPRVLPRSKRRSPYRPAFRKEPRGRPSKAPARRVGKSRARRGVRGYGPRKPPSRRPDPHGGIPRRGPEPGLSFPSRRRKEVRECRICPASHIVVETRHRRVF